MCSKPHWMFSRCLVFILLLASLLAQPGLAQSPTPLANLDIALWPEYDRPEVLVIFRGRIADAATLPAQLSFSLPATVQNLHAVAYLDEARGSLVDIPDYTFSPSGAGKVLSFSTDGRQFQFEYYHADVLNISGDARTLSFAFAPSADIADLTLEVQQPTAAQAFTSNPPPSTTQVGQNGLTYALYQIGAVSTGESRSLQASYTRNTDQLSAPEDVSLPSTTEQTPVEVGGGGLKDNLGLILVGLGVLLLTGSLIYWFWSQRAVVVPEQGPRQSSARRARAARPRAPDVPRPPAPQVTGETLAAYCHRCGTKFRGDARYCHACGAERRAEEP